DCRGGRNATPSSQVIFEERLGEGCDPEPDGNVQRPRGLGSSHSSLSTKGSTDSSCIGRECGMLLRPILPNSRNRLSRLSSKTNEPCKGPTDKKARSPT